MGETHVEPQRDEMMKRWVLSFGRHAEVLEPEGLRKEMEGEVQAILKTYLARPRSERNAPRESRD